MRVKRVVAVRHRNRKIVRVVLLLALAASVVFFVSQRKDFLIQEARRSLEAVFSHESEMEVSIGEIRGKILGAIYFKDVRIYEKGDLPKESREIFSVQQITVRYHLLDFLSKKFNSSIVVLVDKPAVTWKPRMRLSRDYNFPFLRWMRDWALSQKNNIEIHIRGMQIMMAGSALKLEDVDADYHDNSLALVIPLRHIAAGTMDVSTVLKAEGVFRLGVFGQPDSIKGTISTEGSVVNWSPLTEESRFSFDFSRSGFKLYPSKVLGGIEIEGQVDFENDIDSHWSVMADNYPLANLNFIFKSSIEPLLPTHADLALTFEGSAPMLAVHGRARIYNGHIGKKTYKAMDLDINGVYPTVRLENSRLLLQDDSVMKFANRALEFRELFNEKTYEALVSEAQQDTVVWGDWEFRRDREVNDNPMFFLDHALGDRARVNLREYKEEEPIQEPGDNKLGVGLEYNIAGKNKLKLEVRGDENLVGVERKTTF